MNGTNSNSDPDGSSVKRRRYLQGVAVAGGAVGLGGLALSSVSAQEESVTAEFCGEFSPGPQIQQCISCVEAECPDQDVFPLYPLYETGEVRCFEPDVIPDGSEWVALKAGQFCYVAPVDGNTEFCVPEDAPDISNVTFYRCGGEPTPVIDSVQVTCDEITVFTQNIGDNTPLTATVTFLDSDGQESQDTFGASVQDGVATFDLPGDLDPTHLVITLNDTVLYDQDILAEDAPCGPEPPVFENLEVTCDAITIFTDLPEGEELTGTVTFVGDIVAPYTAIVGDDGVAVIPLPGDIDPSHLVVNHGEETLFDGNIQAIDAPCGELPPPEPPEPPVIPDPKKPVEPPKKDKGKRRRKKDKKGQEGKTNCHESNR